MKMKVVVTLTSADIAKFLKQGGYTATPVQIRLLMSSPDFVSAVKWDMLECWKGQNDAREAPDAIETVYGRVFKD